MHASRTVNQSWQQLKPGDRVDDYGFSTEDYFIVAEIHPNRALVYKSDRYGASFSWSLILHESSTAPAAQTLVHLRFRGKITATGFLKSLLVWSGGLFDHITAKPMVDGLAERCENAHWIYSGQSCDFCQFQSHAICQTFTSIVLYQIKDLS